MYELIQVGENTWYMDCPAKVGIARTGEGTGVLIDAGNDGDAAKKALKLLDQLGLKLEAVYCTHSHADHIGGCHLLQQRTGCKIYLPPEELPFADVNILEPAFLFGGRPPRPLRNKFLMAKPCRAEALTEEILPTGWSMVTIGGHSFSMALLKTPDDVWFVGDAVAAEETLKKYPVSYLNDVDEFLNGLDTLLTLQGALFVPAHAPACESMTHLAEVNRANTLSVCALIKDICAQPVSFDQVLQGVFDRLGHTLNFLQYALVGCTLRSYLSSLLDKGEIVTEVEDNQLLWHTVEEPGC